MIISRLIFFCPLQIEMMVVRTIKPPTLQIALPPAQEIGGQMLVGIKTLVNQIGGWGLRRQLIRAGV